MCIWEDNMLKLILNVKECMWTGFMWLEIGFSEDSIKSKYKLVTCQLLGSKKWLLGGNVVNMLNDYEIHNVVNMLNDYEIHNDMYCTYHKTIRSLILLDI